MTRDTDPTQEDMVKRIREMFGEADRDEWALAEAESTYWFAANYHGGQWSNLYAALSGSTFSPGACSSGCEGGSLGQDFYEALEEEFGGVLR